MALLAAFLAGAPAVAHVFLTFPGTAFSDTPVAFQIHWVAGPCGPGPLFGDNVHPTVESTADPTVFRIPWGEYPGGACTEFSQLTEDVADGTMGVLPAGLYTLEVRDEVSGLLIAFAQVQVYDRPPCVPSDSRLCLHGGRFGVTVDWKDFQGGTGVGHAVPRDASGFLADTGFVWFFRPDNYELLVKVLDGCALGGHYWVFISPGSTVEYEIEVEDFASGEVRRYSNPAGTVPKLVSDTAAFPCG